MLFFLSRAALLLTLLYPLVASSTIKQHPSLGILTKHKRNVHRAKRAYISRATNDSASVDGSDTGSTCTNGPFSRNCWDGTLDINTDMDITWPDTGNTVKYIFTLTDEKMAPDGYYKEMQVVNAQYPGPTVEAYWGDDIEITVINKLRSNGTGIHWHGIRQLYTNDMDGTGGVTECPIPPGGTRVYKFKATQYGTSWWHSHYSIQYAAGVVGPIIIHGPATANYDIDLGALPFSDWFHGNMYSINTATLHANGPPTADNLLVNGSMPSTFGGNYSITHLTSGKSHLLRFVNTGINNWINVALDGHPFEVIAADFVPIVPFTTNSLTVAIGQRYDVIIHANQSVDNYWLRVNTGGGCDGPNLNAEHLKTIFRYEGAPILDPVSNATAPLSQGCHDMPNLVPWVHTQVPQEIPEELTVTFTRSAADGNLVQWYIDDSPMHVNFSKPSLQHVIEGNDTFGTLSNVYNVGEADKFQYWVIQQNSSNIAAVPHPIHLHGHDFYILDAQDGATWSGDTSRLQTNNPTRRDTATLPARGYVVLAFESDNPGVWLMHCHIPFHTSQGFGVQFSERGQDILDVVALEQDFSDECRLWEEWRQSYYPDGFPDGDVGL